MRKLLLLCALCGSALTPGARAQVCPSPGGPAKVTVSDTLRYANGSLAAGRLEISWPRMTSADGCTVAAGHVTATVSAGVVTVSLVPNIGASPSGASYSVDYYLTAGAGAVREYWVVPATGPVTIHEIRTSPAPTPVLSTLPEHSLTLGSGLAVLLGLARYTTAAAPAPGAAGRCYYDTTLDAIRCSNNALAYVSPGGIWGAITGTLSNQTDVQGALDAKVPATRSISTTAPLAGGGNLTADRTLSCATATNLAAGCVAGMTTATSAVAASTDDARMTDARTPTAHASSHLSNGVDAIAAASTTVRGTVTTTTASSQVASTDDTRLSDARTPTAHVLADTTGLGAQHTTSGLTAGQVLRASAATTAAFAVIQDGDLPATITRDSEINVQGTANEITSTGSGVAPVLSIASSFDLSGKTSLKVPVAAGAAPTVSGLLAYDSTANLFKGGANAVGKTFAFTDSSITGNAATATALAADPGDCSGNNFALGIAASGLAACAQPAFTNLSGAIAGGQQNNPAVGAKGGVEAKTCTGTDKLSAIGTDGVPVCSADQVGGAGGGYSALAGDSGTASKTATEAAKIVGTAGEIATVAADGSPDDTVTISLPATLSTDKTVSGAWGFTAPASVTLSGAKTASSTALSASNTATSNTAAIDRVALDVTATGSWTGTDAKSYALRVHPSTESLAGWDMWIGPPASAADPFFLPSNAPVGRNVFTSIGDIDKDKTILAYHETGSTFSMGDSRFGVEADTVDKHTAGTMTYLGGYNANVYARGSAPTTTVNSYAAYAEHKGTSTVGSLFAFGGWSQTVAIASAGNITNFGGLYVGGDHADSATVSNTMGVWIDAFTKSGAGIMSNAYGLKIENQLAAGNNWSIKSGLGLVQFGDLLQLDGNATSKRQLALPSMGSDPASPVSGDLWNNAGALKFYNGATKTLAFLDSAPAAHVLADTTGLGAQHTTSGLTAGQVLRASAATTAAFASIQDGDLPATIARDSEINVQGTANEITSTGSGVAPVLSISSTFDLSAKTATLPVKAGTTAGAPATCTANKELYIKMDASAGQQLFICNGTGNGWVLVGDGGGAGGGYATIQEEATPLTQRTTVNFIGPAVTAADDGVNTRTNVTVIASGTGACAANTWASTLNDGAAPTCTQPASSNLSDSANLAKLDAANSFSANSTTAMVVAQAANNTLVVDTTNKRVGAGRVPAGYTFEVADTAAIAASGTGAARIRLSAGTAGAAEIQAASSARPLNFTNSSGTTILSLANADGAITSATLNAESTGNTITAPSKIYMVAAGCDNATAGAGFDVPATGAAGKACLGTTATRFGVLTYADAATSDAYTSLVLPDDWTGTGGVDIKVLYTGDTSSALAIRWSVRTACVADGEDLLAPTWQTASAANAAGPTTAGQRKSNSFAGVTVTNCAAGETMFIDTQRIGADAGDTYTGVAQLLALEVTIRRAM